MNRDARSERGPVPLLQRNSIRTRLSWAFALFRLLVLGLGLFSIWRLADVNAASAEIRDRWLQSTRVLGDLNNYTSDYRAAEASHLLAPGGADMAAAERELDELERSVVQAERNYESLPHDPTEQHLWVEFASNWEAYRQVAAQVVALSASGHKTEGDALYLGASRTTYAAASDTLGVLTDRTVSAAHEASDRAARIFGQARILILLAILVAGGMTFLLMRHIRRSVSEPILELAARMRSLAANRTGVEVPGTGREDEIGEMARAVVVFRNNAIELAHSRRGLEQQASMLAEKLEQEQRLTTLQRNFVSMASHEFRTPLTVIDGQAQRLMKLKGPVAPGELAERAAKIRAAVLRMANLIESLLNTAQLFDGEARLYYHPAEIDLSAVLREVCQMYREITPGTQILEDLRQLPPTLSGDSKLLYQAFSNLLSNAIKYSPKGGAIEVSADTEPGQVRIAVADHGIGIPSADRARLFERYHRGSNVKGIVGTGIGLYLVKTVVTLHGGSVEVDSSEGRGSKFVVRLPNPPQPAAAPADAMVELGRRTAGEPGQIVEG